MYTNNTNNQQSLQTSGLARYRSAPSAFFANLTDDSGCGSDFSNVSVSQHELDHHSNLGEYFNSSSSVYHDLSDNHPTRSFVLPQGIKLENRASVNLVKQNNVSRSAQSEVFSDLLAVESGFSAARDVGNFKFFNGTTNGGEANRSMDYWDEPAVTGLKRTRDGNAKMFSATQTQNWDERSGHAHASGLARHMSLPSSSAEMAAVAKFLHFQDSTTPCKIRAKRGFATHPRSIAERVRRTRISERMRKLQELFPDMSKQTNTADMLEMAVDYIKNLQKQVNVLTDTKSSCTCSSKQRQFSHVIA